MLGQLVALATAAVAAFQARNYAEVMRTIGRLLGVAADAGFFGEDTEGGPPRMMGQNERMDIERLDECCQKMKDCAAECEATDVNVMSAGFGAVNPVVVALLLKAAVEVLQAFLARRR